MLSWPSQTPHARNESKFPAKVVRNWLVRLHVDLLTLPRNKVHSLHVVSVVSLNGSIVHPREVFMAAILGNAAAVILYHTLEDI